MLMRCHRELLCNQSCKIYSMCVPEIESVCIYIYMVALKREPASMTFLYMAHPRKWSNIVLGPMPVWWSVVSGC